MLKSYAQALCKLNTSDDSRIAQISNKTSAFFSAKMCNDLMCAIPIY